MGQCVIALGFFDGVHLGHGGLLRKAREVADRLGLPAGVMTFDTHPDVLVRGEIIPLLNTIQDREYLMKSLYGVDEVHLLHFDQKTMNQPWEEFIDKTLCQTYHAAHVICGHDYRFGAKGQGNPQRLAEACKKRGMGFDCIPEIRLEGRTVSSTLIRTLLKEGKMSEAVRFLGHPHIFTGTVVSGRKLGRTLGIPTANLAIPEGILIPKYGVYGARAVFDGMERRAVVNIGSRPTVNGSHVTVEPWILDFDGDLYGHTLRLELLEFIRPERKFDSLDDLKKEILRNAEQVKNM